MAEETRPSEGSIGGDSEGAQSGGDQAGSAETDANVQGSGGKETKPGQGATSGSGTQGPQTVNVYQLIERLNAPRSSFGADFRRTEHSDERQGEDREEGPLEESAIAGLVRTYARPACYEEAARTLAHNRVVVLTGTTGTGRRTGAVVLLDTVRHSGQPLIQLSPETTVDALASRSFEEGMGYLIRDKCADHMTSPMAEYHWDEVCRKVRQAKAHLVVTTGAGLIPDGVDTVRQIPWQRPAAVDALRQHLGAADVAEETVTILSEALGQDYALADVAWAARQVTAGGNVAEVVDNLNKSAQQTVEDWLDEVDGAIPAVLEVAALAFVVGVSERTFEAEVLNLKERLGEFAPDLDLTSIKAQTEIDLRFRQLRRLRAKHSLLTVQQVPLIRNSGSLASRHVTFIRPEYRRYVVAGLWNSLSHEFWTGIRGWLQDIADGDGYSEEQHIELMDNAAAGLALLGLVAPDEIIESYLGPWSAEDASPGKQMMALLLVWRMSMLDRLAPLALRIAVVWAGQGRKTQRILAAYAFSGELGARYPIEATRRLSQLADQREPETAVAFARLFATLAAQEGDASVVVGVLRRRMKSKKDRPSADLVMATVSELLSVRDVHSGRLAVAGFLIAWPKHAAVVGRLWARALYLRPWRDQAITALLATVRTVARQTPGAVPKHLPAVDPESLVRSLGAAIGSALPETERRIVQQEVMRRDEKERIRKERGRRSRPEADECPSSADAEFLLEALLKSIMNPSLQVLG